MSDQPPLGFINVTVYNSDGEPIVANVSITCDYGDVVSVHGNDTQGLRALCQLGAAMTMPDAGVIRIMGNDINSLTPAQLAWIRSREIGLLSPEYELLTWLTVKENLTMKSLFSSIPEPEIRAERLLSALHIEHIAGLRPAQITPNEALSVRLIRALMARPHILVIGEPLEKYDTSLRERLFSAIEQFSTGGGTVLFITESEEMAKHGHTIYTLRDCVLTEDW